MNARLLDNLGFIIQKYIFNKVYRADITYCLSKLREDVSDEEYKQIIDEIMKILSGFKDESKKQDILKALAKEVK